ncbi:MAG: type II secretion system F family protein [Planctomycetota bacterium]|jgi:type II secretory pathway component PulF
MLRPLRDEREALRLEDIASAVNAGLPLTTILPATDLTSGFAAGLCQQRDITLSTTERAMLAAAEASGTIPASLGLLAEQRRRRAGFARNLGRQSRYPLILVFVAILAAFATAPVRGQSYVSLLLAVMGVFAVVVLSGWFVRRRISNPNFDGGPAPLRELLQDLAEVPYLQSLLGLYAAGVKVHEAHQLAANSVAVPYVRHRLRAANTGLESNRSLAESLARSNALCLETQQLVTTGEAAGELEDALRRSLQRRLDCLERRLGRWATAIATTVYALAAAYAIYLVFAFYGNYYGRLLGR